MSISYEWKVPKRVIIVNVEGTVERGELKQYNDSLKEMVASGDKPVHVLANATNVTKINVPPREAISGSSYLRHENVGHVVVIGTSGVIEFFITLVKAVIPMKLLKADTVEAAMKKLRENDHTLA